MECNETRDLLAAYVDGELSLREESDVEQHLRTCTACRGEIAGQGAVRRALREELAYFAAPPDLARRVKAALPAPTAPPRRGAGGWWGWANAGMALVSLIAVAWSAGLYLATPSVGDRIVQDVVASHIRSLLSNHPVDVSSSDRHTVKPWFNGKLDYSPPVYDLTTDGFPLVGGRVDYLNQRPVAALVYRHRLHAISLYILPAVKLTSLLPAAQSHEGFHIVHWRRGEMDFWAVSDVSSDQLEKFEKTFRAQ